MPRKEFRELADPTTAREAIASLDLTPDPETVPLAEARGRVLAQRVDAGLDVPGFDRASVDGYAVRAKDTFGADEADPARLALAGRVDAGEAPHVAVEAGRCVEVSTGAVLPEGADAVVMVERTDRDPDDEAAVLVRTAVAPGDRVMVAGADVAAGERALGPGTELTAREVGLLSALGVDEVPVRGAPRVGIVSTGDELVRPGEPVDSEAGQIYDVNSYAVAAAVEAAGGDPALYPHVGDDAAEMERVLRRAADECDLVLSSGSTSASAVDVVYRVVEDRGDLLLHGVAVKPGKPMLVGRMDGSAYVGLPGYPVSALTIFRTFVAPAVRRAAGRPEPRTATVGGEMAVEARYAEGRLRLMPVGLVADGAGATLAYPVDKGSGATTSLVEADGVVEVPPDTEYLDRGERVTVRLFSPEGRPPGLFGVGEEDPAFGRLLDHVPWNGAPGARGDRSEVRGGTDVGQPRYLARGTGPGLRRLREGVVDVAVTTDPARGADAGSGDPGDGTAGLADVDAPELGRWTREWGLVVPDGDPEDVSGLADLVDRDLSFVGRTDDSGLRRSFDAALAALADDRGVERRALADAVDGYERTVRGTESPARRVLAGTADAGLGLRATAARLGAGFVPVGAETVRVLVNPDRTGKPGVSRLREVLATGDDVVDALPGYGTET